jgi:folate-binding protein YgfZ
MSNPALHDRLAAFGGRLAQYCGAETAASFGDPAREFAALRTAAGLFDLGWRGMIVLTGSDRQRWLNGMVTNNTRDLALNHGNYSLVLNAQGRIQGDLTAYNRGEYYLVVTEAAQLEKLKAFFDRYIIMDDVEVADVSGKLTALGVAGPNSREVLAKAGFNFPELAPGEVVDIDWHNIGISVAHGLGERGESYEVWFAPDHANAIWDALVAAGATPAGYEALDWLRILHGIPRYSVDMTERYLPQETGQDRALHFAKGCYLGQEIVERIRSRALLHRTFAGFVVEGPAPAPESTIMSGDKKVGEITSSAEIPVAIRAPHLPHSADVGTANPGEKVTFALGYIRTESSTPGTEVRINEARALVSALPFTVKD